MKEGDRQPFCSAPAESHFGLGVNGIALAGASDNVGRKVILRVFSYDSGEGQQYFSGTWFDHDDFKRALATLKQTGTFFIQSGRDSDPDIVAMNLMEGNKIELRTYTSISIMRLGKQLWLI